MANITDTGFKWVKGNTGAERAPIEERPVVTTQSGAIFRGDCVKLVSDGTVIKCAAGDAVYGVVTSIVRYKDTSGVIRSGNFLPDATVFSGAPSLSNPQASIVSLIPAAGQVFEADVDTSQATITAAQGIMGNNVNIVATTGSTTTGRSGHVIDGGSTTTPATTSSLQWRLLEIVPDPLNDVTSANWKARVSINLGNQPNLGGTTGV
ncbi:MAG: hypothetical protein F2813_08605 [Actinobacteria bacterium]|uniref:Unannotated protein n=1 Tax=freshwater metagenome TaxID=449393 RepID=A0A6J5ZZ96_9ZZZZ|nr:hypothetical protein [Actinomycetota bacterium]